MSCTSKVGGGGKKEGASLATRSFVRSSCSMKKWIDKGMFVLIVCFVKVHRSDLITRIELLLVMRNYLDKMQSRSGMLL